MPFAAGAGPRSRPPGSTSDAQPGRALHRARALACRPRSAPTWCCQGSLLGELRVLPGPVPRCTSTSQQGKPRSTCRHACVAAHGQMTCRCLSLPRTRHAVLKPPCRAHGPALPACCEAPSGSLVAGASVFHIPEASRGMSSVPRFLPAALTLLPLGCHCPGSPTVCCHPDSAAVGSDGLCPASPQPVSACTATVTSNFMEGELRTGVGSALQHTSREVGQCWDVTQSSLAGKPNLCVPGWAPTSSQVLWGPGCS